MAYTETNAQGPADPADDPVGPWDDSLEKLMGFEPQPTYRALQEEDPAKVIGTRVRLLGMQDILEVNTHHDLLGFGGKGPTLGAKRPLIPLDLDGPEHTKFRKLLDPVFSPRRVALLEPQVRARCAELIEQSLAMCTSLAPVIGYDRAAGIAKAAFEEGRPVREVALARGVVEAGRLEKLLDARGMTEPGVKGAGS